VIERSTDCAAFHTGFIGSVNVAIGYDEIEPIRPIIFSSKHYSLHIMTATLDIKELLACAIAQNCPKLPKQFRAILDSFACELQSHI